MHEMQADLRHADWPTVIDVVPAPRILTPLRALDIIAWMVESGKWDELKRAREQQTDQAALESKRA